MALVNAYATEQEFRDHIGDQGGTLNLTMIERALNTASRMIDQYTGRRFWQDLTTANKRFWPDNQLLLYVDDISTDFTEVRTDEDDDGTYELLWDVADVLREPVNSGIDIGTSFAKWRILAVGTKRFPVARLRPPVQVTAQWGWATTPPEITEATVLKAAKLFNLKNAPLGIAGFGDFGALRISRQDPEVIELIQPYVRIGMNGIA
ncbi:MAG: hypothetical protein GEU81_15305 [Nitriliruptorales bacterium]|nr:hypothetical protein [Nitriliruptorales bacterium]